MAYVDYNYYKDSFGGNSIPETSFSSYERKARTLLDYVTFNRIKDNESLVDSTIKDCLCEVMECKRSIDNSGGIKSAESVDKVSVTYVVNPNDTEFSKCYNIIKIYLGNTNLLYRGVCT